MQEYIAENFKHNGYTVKLIADHDATAPDEFGDDGIILVTTKNRYFERLHDGKSAPELDDDPEMKRKYWAFPVYAYIHSGVALSLGRGGQFADPWDSGRIGTLFLAKSEWRYRTRETKKNWSAEHYAKVHIETWNQYLSGDVWGFEITDADGKDIDSCWGFYGLDYARSEAISNVPDEPCPINGVGEDIAAEETLA